MYTYGTVNSIFVEIQPDSTNIKNDPRIYIDVPRPLTNDLWVFLFQTIDAEYVK